MIFPLCREQEWGFWSHENMWNGVVSFISVSNILYTHPFVDTRHAVQNIHDFDVLPNVFGI